MDFEGYILKYLDHVNYTEWNLLGLLQYLSENVNYTSASVEDISNKLVDLLQTRSINDAYLKSAQRKAEKLYTGLDSTKTRPEIQQFLRNLDLKYAENLYGTDVEFSVVTDRSATVALSSKKYLATVKNGR